MGGRGCQHPSGLLERPANVDCPDVRCALTASTTSKKSRLGVFQIAIVAEPANAAGSRTATAAAAPSPPLAHRRRRSPLPTPWPVGGCGGHHHRHSSRRVTWLCWWPPFVGGRRATGCEHTCHVQPHVPVKIHDWTDQPGIGWGEHTIGVVVMARRAKDIHIRETAADERAPKTALSLPVCGAGRPHGWRWRTPSVAPPPPIPMSNAKTKSPQAKHNPSHSYRCMPGRVGSRACATPRPAADPATPPQRGGGAESPAGLTVCSCRA